MYRYVWIYFSAALLLVGIGFFPSYFSRLTTTDPAHHVHAIITTLWLVLMIVQGWLIGHKGRRLHRRLGKLSYVLMPALIITALAMMRLMMGRPHVGRLAYERFFIDVCTIIELALFWGLAMYYRKDAARHSRYMMAIPLILLPPALGRAFKFYLPRNAHVPNPLILTFFVLEAAALVLLARDWRKGKVYFAYAFLLVCFIVQHVGIELVASRPAWHTFAGIFAGRP